jgi:hypothetical protein
MATWLADIAKIGWSAYQSSTGVPSTPTSSTTTVGRGPAVGPIQSFSAGGVTGTMTGGSPMTDVVATAFGMVKWGTAARFALRLARIIGIDGAANALGIDSGTATRLVGWTLVKRRRRRGRGISAADLRRTRSTVRKINRMNHDLAGLCHRRRISK